MPGDSISAVISLELLPLMTTIKSKKGHYRPHYCNIIAQMLAMFLFTNCTRHTGIPLAAVTTYESMHPDMHCCVT